MPSYVACTDADARKSLEHLIQAVSQGPVISCSTFDELLDFIQLRHSSAEIELVVTTCPEGRSVMETLRALEDLDILVNTPVLILTGQPDYEAFAPGLMLADLAVLPIKPAEIRTRLTALLRLRDVMSEKTEYENDLREMARHAVDLIELRDRETGLASHGTLLQFLDREWRRSLRYDRPVSAIALELGSNSPTEAQLRAFGEILRGCLHRAGDIGGRTGPHRFLVVLSETDPPGALHVAQRILQTFKEAGEGTANDRVLPEIRTGTATLRPKEIYQGMKPGVRGTSPAEQLLVDAAQRALQTAR